MMGLDEIVDANERATDVAWLRGRIREAYDTLVNSRTHDEGAVRRAALILRLSLEPDAQ